METSQNKTKRKIIKELTQGNYTYQSVIFFEDYSPDIFEYAASIRTAVSRGVRCKLLWLVRARHIPKEYLSQLPESHNSNSVVQPYLQVFSSIKMESYVMNEVLFRKGYTAIFRCRKFTEQRKSKWIETFKKQNLTNLDQFKVMSGVSQPRRWTVTNKNLS